MSLSPKLLARIALGTATVVEGVAALARHRERELAFEAAIERAQTTGRRLVVIGDPDASSQNRIGSGGDMYIHNTLVADITHGRVEGVDDDTAVVYVACVLEVVDDLNATLREISRIAGVAENVFIVSIQPWTLTARLSPSARRRGLVVSHGSEHTVHMKPVDSQERLLLATAIGLTLATAFWPTK
jgi:hypothetical protein